jgi:predicted GNAT family N-acyltransferase
VRIFSNPRTARSETRLSDAQTAAPVVVRDSDGLEIRRITTRTEMDAALAIRYDVFCMEQGVPRSEERDGRDHGALHLIAAQDGEIIGTCRLVFVGTTVQFSRLAVVKSARRRGIASELLKVADAETLAAGADRLVLHAQTYARSLYEQAGYVARGREFVEAQIEHVAMEKIL